MKRSTKSATKPKSKRLSFEAIGTYWDIELFGKVPTDIESSMLARIDQFDARYSRFRTDSFVRNLTPGTYDMPDDALPMLELYDQLYALTDGAVTPLIGETLSDAGYDAQYSFEPVKQTVPEQLETVLVHDSKTLTLKQSAVMDFGAAGKGYLVDIICELLKNKGVDSAIINAGGDIRYYSNDTEVVEFGLEHPEDKSLAIGIAAINNRSLCGSSIYARKWGKYHHIIDGRSGVSPMHLKAVWVVANSTMVADGLTTALFFVKPAVLAAHFDFEYVIINQDYSLQYSPGFPAHFFSES